MYMYITMCIDILYRYTGTGLCFFLCETVQRIKFVTHCHVVNYLIKHHHHHVIGTPIGPRESTNSCTNSLGSSPIGPRESTNSRTNSLGSSTETSDGYELVKNPDLNNVKDGFVELKRDAVRGSNKDIEMTENSDDDMIVVDSVKNEEKEVYIFIYINMFVYMYIYICIYI
jgi:hypothetical protein